MTSRWLTEKRWKNTNKINVWGFNVIFTWNHLYMQQSDNHLARFPLLIHCAWVSMHMKIRSLRYYAPTALKLEIEILMFASFPCGPWQQHGASRLCQTDKTDSWKALKPSINQRETLKTDAFLLVNLHAHTHGMSSYRPSSTAYKNNHKTHPLMKKEKAQPHIKHDSNTLSLTEMQML